MGTSKIRYKPESWLFDFLSAYSDLVSSRFANKADNYLNFVNGRQILIDNASTFQTRYTSRKESLAYEWRGLLVGLEKANLTLADIAPSKALYDHMKSLSDEQIRAHLAPFLPKREIENLLARWHQYLEQMRPYVAR